MRAPCTASRLTVRRRRPRLRRSVIGVAVLNVMALALTQPVQAMDAYWSGGEGAWTNGPSWVDGLVPDYADRVFIDALADPAVHSTVWVDSGVAASQVFIGAGDELRIRQGSLTLHGGLVSNQGVLTLQGSPDTGIASLHLAANTTLTGGGSTVLSHPDYSYIYGNGYTLTIGQGHTLRGVGYLGADNNINVVNQGAVIAEGGVLHLSPGDGRSFNNVAGTVTVADGATLSMDSGSFSGGTITGQGQARLAGYGVYRDTQLAGQLQVAAGTSLSLAGTITNTGALTVQGSPDTGAAYLALADDTTLAGSGSTVLSHQDYSYLNASGHTLTIGQDHTLRGAGRVDAYWYADVNVVNKGSVVAEGGRLSFNVGAGQLDNTAGSITVANTGVFSLDSGRLIGGVINGQAGAQLAGSGTYENTKLTGSLQAVSNFTLKDSRLEGQLQVLAGGYVGLAGTLTNTGTLTVEGSPNTGGAYLSLTDHTTLAGNGSTVLSHPDYSYIYGNGYTLTIGQGHTLRGVGYLGLDSNINVVNQGAVIAEGGVLHLSPGDGRSFNNLAGTVTVADGATLSLDSGSFSGGTVTGQGQARLAGYGVYRDTQLAGQLQVAAGTTLSLAGTITNTGTLTVQGSPETGFASLSLADDTTLAGSGSTVLSHQDSSYINGNGHTLIIGQNHTLRGAGSVGGYYNWYGDINVVNKGSVVAEGGRLSFNVSSGQLDNTAGSITVAQDGRFSLDSGRLIGGVINGQAGAQLAGSGTYENTKLTGSLQAVSNFTLKDSQLEGQLQVLAGGSVGLAGTLTNTGTLTVQGSPNTTGAALNLVGDATLAGSGSTVLSHQDSSYIYGNGYTLTIGQGHTLRGVGYVGADNNINVVNQGAVIAEGGVLRLSPGDGRSFNNVAGTVTVADGATLSLDSGGLVGGVVVGQGSAQLVGSGTYDNARLTGGFQVSSNANFKDTRLEGQLQVLAGGNVGLAGTLTNTGTLTVQGSPYTGTASLSLADDTTLAGSGSTVLSHQDSSYINGNGHTLIIGQNHTLRGAGSVGGYYNWYGDINVVNKGSVVAEGGRLSFNVSSGQLDNTAGLITVANTGVFSLGSGRLIGGVIHGQGAAQLAGSGTYENTKLTGSLQASSGLTLKDSRLEGQLQVLAGGYVGLAGTITNTGTLTVQGSPLAGNAYVSLADDTTLTGGGSTVLSHAYYSSMYGNGHTLTIDAGHTLRGAGDLGVDGNINVVNRGSVVAEGGQLSVFMQSGQHFDNTSGLIRIDDTGQMQLYGDLLLGNASQLVFDVAEAGGQAAWGGLDWHAPATFDGTLRLSFDGYTPIVGQQFSLIHFDGNYSGAFDAALANGYTLSLSYADNWVVATVTGVAPVPEPGTWVLWLAGTAVLGAVARRRTRCA